jgi:hypothetical protein
MPAQTRRGHTKYGPFGYSACRGCGCLSILRAADHSNGRDRAEEHTTSRHLGEYEALLDISSETPHTAWPGYAARYAAVNNSHESWTI